MAPKTMTPCAQVTRILLLAVVRIPIADAVWAKLQNDVNYLQGCVTNKQATGLCPNVRGLRANRF